MTFYFRWSKSFDAEIGGEIAVDEIGPKVVDRQKA